MIDVSGIKSVLDERFSEKLLSFSTQLEGYLCHLFSEENDAKDIRKQLNNMVNNQFITLKARLIQESRPDCIVSFTQNMILVPLFGGKIRLHHFDVEKSGLSLKSLSFKDFEEGELITIDENSRFFAMEILRPGVLLQASDNKAYAFQQSFDIDSLQRIRVLPTDKKVSFVYRACELLAWMGSEKCKDLLLDLATNADDMVRWQAAKSYCGCVDKTNAFTLLEQMAKEDPAIPIQNLALATLQRNRGD